MTKDVRLARARQETQAALRALLRDPPAVDVALAYLTSARDRVEWILGDEARQARETEQAAAKRAAERVLIANLRLALPRLKMKARLSQHNGVSVSVRLRREDAWARAYNRVLAYDHGQAPFHRLAGPKGWLP